jgi:hypothetical protein
MPDLLVGMDYKMLEAVWVLACGYGKSNDYQGQVGMGEVMLSLPEFRCVLDFALRYVYELLHCSTCIISSAPQGGPHTYF